MGRNERDLVWKGFRYWSDGMLFELKVIDEFSKEKCWGFWTKDADITLIDETNKDITLQGALFPCIPTKEHEKIVATLAESEKTISVSRLKWAVELIEKPYQFYRLKELLWLLLGLNEEKKKIRGGNGK